MRATTQAADRLFGPEQIVCRDPPDRKDQARLDQRDLAVQKRLTGGGLLGVRVAVARWPALDDVGDVDLIAPEPDRLEHGVEQLPGAPDERLSLAILVGARRLADHHQARLPVADAKNGLGPGLVQIAGLAAGDCRV